MVGSDAGQFGSRSPDFEARGLEVRVEYEQGSFSLAASFTGKPGETVVLVGPSGSGKTTLLRLLAGLATPRQGHIRLGEQVLLDTERRIDLPPWQRRIGVVFQDYALFPHLTVEANVGYGLRGLPDARARGTGWLEALGIAELARRKPRELSGGQQQRVALARAAACDSDLLLLDEPFAALDAATRRSVRGEMRRFLERVYSTESGQPGRITLLITHDYLDALTLGDRIVVLENGSVTQSGPRDEVLHSPRTPFLAELTGHNVLEGRLDPSEAGSDLRTVHVGGIEVHVAGASELPAGSVFLSFGPEEVALFRSGPLPPGSASARNRFPCVVREIVPLPDRLRVYLSLVLDPHVTITAEVVRSAAEELGLTEGVAVMAAVKSTAIQVYR